MRPEEKFDEDVWFVLKKIKERSLYTETGKLIPYFVISKSSEFFNYPISTEDHVAVLKKLREQGVIKLIRLLNDKNELPPDIYIEIIQPAFDQLYEFHYIITDTLQKHRNKKEESALSKLNSVKIKFNDDEAILEIGDKKCALPAYKNEHYFCQVMFEHKPKEPISWDIIYDRMTGNNITGLGEKPKPIRKNWQQVNDTMKRVNNRIKQMIGTNDKLFSWSERTIIRRY